MTLRKEIEDIVYHKMDTDAICRLFKERLEKMNWSGASVQADDVNDLITELSGERV